jgi:hypothetical protein
VRFGLYHPHQPWSMPASIIDGIINQAYPSRLFQLLDRNHAHNDQLRDRRRRRVPGPLIPRPPTTDHPPPKDLP